MDRNIIDDLINIPVEERTDDDFDDLIRTLELVWSNKVYQDGLLEFTQSSNRELYDLTLTMAQGLINQDNGCKATMIKYKERYKQQADKVLSAFSLNNMDILFTEKQLRQVCMYYLGEEPIYFTKAMFIDDSPSDIHRFTFGEIVETVSEGEEVIVVNETKRTIEYITLKMVCDEEKYIIPKIGLKNKYKSKESDECYAFTEPQVNNVYEQYASIFKTLA